MMCLVPGQLLLVTEDGEAERLAPGRGARPPPGRDRQSVHGTQEAGDGAGGLQSAGRGREARVSVHTPSRSFSVCSVKTVVHPLRCLLRWEGRGFQLWGLSGDPGPFQKQ